MAKLDYSKLSTNIQLFARQVVEGFISGKHKSPYHGFSVEFAEHRSYNTGESTKNIDWKLYARTDKLFLKRYEEETNLRCCIVIDTSSSMYYPVNKMPTLNNPNKILYSVYSAACLMNLFKKQRDSVGLSLFSEELEFHSENKSAQKHHILLKKRMLEILDYDDSRIKETLSVNSLHTIASRLHKRSLVLIFTDMLEGVENLSEIFLALQHLKFNKHEVVIFHLIDAKTEYNFDFSNTPHKFIDIETRKEVKLNPLEVKKEFQERSKEFLKDLNMRCLQHKIDLVEIDINDSIEKILSTYLIKRKKMF